MDLDSMNQQIARVVEDLVAEYSGSVAPETVRSVVDRYRAELEPAAKVTDYIPVLVRRYARETLQAQVAPALSRTA